MKNEIAGVILAGGLGRRLDPLTRVANKHLLPVYDQPMIYYPLEKMIRAGIDDILIVCGEGNQDDFEQLLRNERRFQSTSIEFTTQVGEDGIAAALALAEDFAADRRICVVLGDNLFEDDLDFELENYRSQREGARILLKNVPDPERFGVPVFDGEKLIGIEEKPNRPKSPYAVVGIYFYDSRVFDIIRTLEPSDRGEYEITDVSNSYIASGNLSYGYLNGWWSDCGTFESLHEASRLVREQKTQSMEIIRD